MAKISKEKWKVYGNVFSEYTNRNLFRLASQGHFDELSSPIAVGKEANVFTAKKDDRFVIVKIYRLESCNFNKMYSYLIEDPRYMNIKKQRRQVIFLWTQREYRNLLNARKIINVPTPYAIRDNIIVMEFVGVKNQIAEQLKNVHPKDPKKFYKQIMDNIKKLQDAGFVHGDLSEYNILNRDEEPVFIDFSQCMPISTPNSKEILERDIKNVKKFFKKLGVDVD